jgi:hypothetical protein
MNTFTACFLEVDEMCNTRVTQKRIQKIRTKQKNIFQESGLEYDGVEEGTIE